MKDCQGILEFCFSSYLGKVRKIETALCLEKVQLNQSQCLLGKVSHSLYWCLDSISEWPKGVIKSGN